MRLTRFEPFRIADALQADLERRQARSTGWQPAADIVEYADAYLVRLDVPGVSSDAIDIETDKGLLSISGERAAFDAGDDARLTRNERRSGKFIRRFTLPETADVEQIRAQVGDEKVILGLSGGVDSSVVAALLHRAIGESLTCVFVDNGLLRQHEGDAVMEAFAQATNNAFDLNIVRIDAEEEFLDALAGIDEPERKRKIIGETFIDVFEREAKRIEGVRYLAQGTIYPDVIESAASKFGKAHVIKSHHNVGGLPERMDLELVEPLRELFKDEVRRIGLELGLPHDLIHRHPFPGPGLGVRILGEIRKEYADILREADAIFLDELRAAGWYDKVSQAFAVFLPVRSVGVVGDQRRYEYVVALRAVETVDFMTAHWAELPHELLARTSTRIINEISGISRVVYDISGKPPATIEWE